MSNSIPKLRAYLCPPGNQIHERRLVFRNYCRRNDDVAKEYSFLKRRLADQRLAGTVPI
ncbi:GrpB family protein [Rhizobium sp. BK060]|uniref:GrpB family protein n=1 Tax=Rhizobium sp. BK060 TaxID=2587096 RepID=UPI0032B2ADB3